MKVRCKQLFILLFQIVFCVTFSYGQLQEINNFGSNPGNLRSYIYVPKNGIAGTQLSLVVALHGCSQNAQEISDETGWNKLADEYGFIVLYPEQKSANNVSRCFNWFSKSDIQFNGESESINSMIDYVKHNYSINNSNVFCYGLSAGGAMCTALMAQYPETFNTGAVLAGGPYGLARNAYQALQVMKDGNTDHTSPAELAKLITELHKTSKSYPKLIVLHGTNDKVVDPANASNLVNQWLGLHPTITTEPLEEKEISLADGHILRISHFIDKTSQETIVKNYQIENLGHMLPVNPGNNYNEGGKVGRFAIDLDFFSTYFIAKDFGLLKE